MRRSFSAELPWALVALRNCFICAVTLANPDFPSLRPKGSESETFRLVDLGVLRDLLVGVDVVFGWLVPARPSSTSLLKDSWP